MVTKSRNIALVDLDGTLCDFRGQLDSDVARVLKDGRKQVNVPSCVLQQIEWLIRRQDGWYRNLKPLPLGFEIVRMLKDVGFKLNILTKSSKESKNAWSEKTDWVSRHLPEAKMTVTEDKSLFYGKVLVDDYPGHFLPWMAHRPRGIVIMPVQPWNKMTTKIENLYPVANRKDLLAIRPILVEAFNRKGGNSGSAR